MAMNVNTRIVVDNLSRLALRVDMFGCEVLSIRFLIINSNMVLVVSASRTLVNGASTQL